MISIIRLFHLYGIAEKTMVLGASGPFLIEVEIFQKNSVFTSSFYRPAGSRAGP
jgi:hypothetical protein